MSKKAKVLNPIYVTHHAAERYHQRSRDQRHFNLEFEAIKEEIRAMVEEGIRRGHLFNHRPKAFRLYGQRNQILAPDEMFVYPDPQSRYGFIIRRNEKEEIVKTTILRTKS